MKNLDISIVIVSYNTEKLLKNCLESIMANKNRLNIEIFVVDNNSKDNSVQMVKEIYPNVKLIVNKENLGFGAANNQALKSAKGKYILFLNSDTVVLENALEELFSFAETKKDCGAVGARLFWDEDKTVQKTCSTFPTPLILLVQTTCLSKTSIGKKILDKHWYEGWERNFTRPVQAISGACMLVSRQVLEQVGTFDEKFFMYFEDIDLSKRIAEAGYTNYFCADSEFIHFSGQSTEKNEFYNEVFRKSMYLYVRKHYGLTNFLMFSGLRSFLNLLSSIIKF